MVLKKELVKEIKNFTVNFGPQHPAAHGRRPPGLRENVQFWRESG